MMSAAVVDGEAGAACFGCVCRRHQRSGSQTDAQPSDLAHPSLGESVGGHRRRHAVLGASRNTSLVVSNIFSARCSARSKENPRARRRPGSGRRR